jgi:mannose-6-phosphate isomerase-like protein (cupin superfamily)
MKSFGWGVLPALVAGVMSLSAWGQGAASVSAGPVLSEAKVFNMDQLAVAKTPTGGEMRNITSGTLATGEAVSLHETTQPVGAAPSTAHRIEHTEFIVVVSGTVAFEHDGKAERVGKGGVILVAPGTMHSLRNVGEVPAQYCVIAIGGDVKK